MPTVMEKPGSRTKTPRLVMISIDNLIKVKFCLEYSVQVWESAKIILLQGNNMLEMCRLHQLNIPPNPQCWQTVNRVGSHWQKKQPSQRPSNCWQGRGTLNTELCDSAVLEFFKGTQIIPTIGRGFTNNRARIQVIQTIGRGFRIYKQ